MMGLEGLYDTRPTKYKGGGSGDHPPDKIEAFHANSSVLSTYGHIFIPYLCDSMDNQFTSQAYGAVKHGQFA